MTEKVYLAVTFSKLQLDIYMRPSLLCRKRFAKVINLRPRLVLSKEQTRTKFIHILIGTVYSYGWHRSLVEGSRKLTQKFAGYGHFEGWVVIASNCTMGQFMKTDFLPDSLKTVSQNRLLLFSNPSGFLRTTL